MIKKFLKAFFKGLSKPFSKKNNELTIKNEDIEVKKVNLKLKDKIILSILGILILSLETIFMNNLVAFLIIVPLILLIIIVSFKNLK